MTPARRPSGAAVQKNGGGGENAGLSQQKKFLRGSFSEAFVEGSVLRY